MSDRIAVMSHGQVLQMGPAVEIYERPTSRFVADFIGESNFLDGKLISLRGDRAVVDVPAWGSELECIATSRLEVGQQVAVSIRPEKIRLIEEAEGRDKCMEGVVVNSTYIGSDTHVYIDVRGQHLKVWEQNRVSTLDPRAYYRNGETVWLRLLPENTLVVPKD